MSEVHHLTVIEGKGGGGQHGAVCYSLTSCGAGSPEPEELGSLCSRSCLSCPARRTAWPHWLLRGLPSSGTGLGEPHGGQPAAWFTLLVSLLSFMYEYVQKNGIAFANRASISPYLGKIANFPLGSCGSELQVGLLGGEHVTRC